METIDLSRSYATPSSIGASERSKWSEDSAFEQAEARFSVVTRGLGVLIYF